VYPFEVWVYCGVLFEHNHGALATWLKSHSDLQAVGLCVSDAMHSQGVVLFPSRQVLEVYDVNFPFSVSKITSALHRYFHGWDIVLYTGGVPGLDTSTQLCKAWAMWMVYQRLVQGPASFVTTSPNVVIEAALQKVGDDVNQAIQTFADKLLELLQDRYMAVLPPGGNLPAVRATSQSIRRGGTLRGCFTTSAALFPEAHGQSAFSYPLKVANVTVQAVTEDSLEMVRVQENLDLDELKHIIHRFGKGSAFDSKGDMTWYIMKSCWGKILFQFGFQVACFYAVFKWGQQSPCPN
jgi:hypothetical protein